MEMNEQDFDAMLRDKMQGLDHSYPALLPGKDAIWVDLESQLPSSQENHPWRYILAVAASVTLLLVASLWWLKQEANESVAVVYRTEVTSRPNAKEDVLFGQAESEGISFIEEQCRLQQPVCSSTAFTELKRELDQLTYEAKQVNEQMKTFGPDPALVKAEIRLENHKAYLIRTLIQILKA